MFVKEIKIKNKKTGAVYVKHALVESTREGEKVRPRVIMNLGRLDIPRDLWPQLAEELAARLTGQQRLNIPGVKTKKCVRVAADRAMENHLLKVERQRKRAERVERKKKHRGKHGGGFSRQSDHKCEPFFRDRASLRSCLESFWAT